MPNNAPPKEELRRDIGVTGIVALGLGTAIGVSVYSVLAPATQLAGVAMIVSMLLAMVPMMVYAIIYGFMGAAVPVTGASYEWPRRFVHPFLGFIISWLRIAGSTSAVIVLTMVLVSYAGAFIALPLKPTMFALLVFVLVVNLLGVSAAAKSQGVMLVILLGTCALFAFGSVPSIEVSNFTPFASHGAAGVFAAVPLLISLFLGIESATEVGGEVKNPARSIPLGIAISIVLTAVVYLMVAIAALGVLGPEKLGASSAPLLDAGIAAFGPAGRYLIVASAVVAIGSSINATFIIMSRFLYAMAREGMLPSPLAKVSGKHDVPLAAILCAFVLCCIGLFLPENLVFLFLAVNIPTILKYSATCLAAVGLLRKRPDLYEAARFRPAKGMIYALAVAGVGLGILIIVAGWSADWRPYALLLAWAFIGCLYYLIIGRRPGAKAEPAVSLASE
ncbi:MAG: APC family permease [Alphaproteobacteria bacterium]|nr:APC family permease [Alphaproteobacteria bacterium]MBU2142353.1 APC family permease [Alphaproteobacteria bacterium]MBU2197225.1 APC family permease [Alphaproteobacteria bacterium]